MALAGRLRSTAELNEDVVWPERLTVLWADSLPEPDEEDEVEETDDDLLPSQRWSERGWGLRA